LRVYIAAVLTDNLIGKTKRSEMPTKTSKTIYEFRPVGWDIWDNRTSLTAGDLVVKTQPHGCPTNGTMGHCFVADPETGDFLGLVLLKSLRRAKKGATR
jgi:hypothetical protein